MTGKAHGGDGGRDAPVVLSLRNITKRFGPLVANEAIDLDVRRGEIVALLGENGAGKTTLMNILFGHYVADEGEVLVARGEGGLTPLEPGSPRAALDAGVGMVHQHFTLAENLTGFENIVLGTQSPFSFSVSRRRARARLDRQMAESGLTVALDVQVSGLSVGEKQRVEILKALYRDATILVMDEPTAVLTPQEVERLFDTLRRLAAKGLAVVFIAHKLSEVLAIADRIAVLRGGRKAGEMVRADADRRRIAEMMVGREVAPTQRQPGTPGATLLELSRVSAGAASDRDALRDVSLAVRAGEIVGIAGVSGNGQARLAAVIAGLATVGQGTFELFGEPVSRADPRRFAAAGIARIPEDRHHDGVIGAMSVAENVVVEEIRDGAYARLGFLKPRAIRARGETAIRDYDVRCQGPDAPARQLSGGNIQKLILARVLDRLPRIVLANQPSRGLDVGAQGEVHRRLLEARGRGAGIVLISEDLDELLALSDRVAVIHAGELSATFATDEVDRATLGLMMAGHSREDAA